MMPTIEIGVLCSCPTVAEALLGSLNAAGLSALSRWSPTQTPGPGQVILAVGSGTRPLPRPAAAGTGARVVYLALEPTLRSLLEAMHLNSDAIVAPDCSLQSLAAVLRAVGEGSHLPGPAAMLGRIPMPDPLSTGCTVQLTQRQLEIACAMGRGRSYQQTAKTMFITPYTVEFHVRKLLAATGLGDRWMLSEWLDAPLPLDIFPCYDGLTGTRGAARLERASEPDTT